MILQNETIHLKQKVLLKNINLSISKGEKVAILGKSGSGKTTLLKKLYKIAKNNTSYIPQKLGLVDTLSVFHNIYISQLDKHGALYNIRNLIRPIKREEESIKEVLKQLNMQHLIFNRCSKISGGERQRVAIARAILQGHNILIADEPISNLDEKIQDQALEVLINKFDTIICALHSIDVALKYFDRIIGIKDNEITLNKKYNEVNHKEIKDLY